MVIPAGASVDISGVAATVKSLTLSGSGTVTLSGRLTRTLADSLVVESGTTLSLASGTTVYVPTATAGGAALAAGSYAGGSQSWLAGSGTLKGNVTVTDKLVFNAAQPATPGLTVNGTLNVANGVTVEIASTNLLARGTTYTLATFPTPLASVPVSNLTRPWCVFLTNGGRTLKMCYQEGTMLLLK